MIYKHIYNSKIGNICIKADENNLLEVYFTEDNQVSEPDDSSSQPNEIIKETEKQLNEYFSGKRQVFGLPLNPKGTDFRKKVWEKLKTIPYGETRTYKDIAVMIGNPKASRAVGNANNKNPIGIIIPCHRVIGSNKKLIGYSGGIDKKEKLLKLESENKKRII